MSVDATRMKAALEAAFFFFVPARIQRKPTSLMAEARLAPSQGAGSRSLEQSLKRRTFSVASGGTSGRMLQASAHRLQLRDGRIDLIFFGQQERSINQRLPARREHGAYFVQRETASLTERNKGQLF